MALEKGLKVTFALRPDANLIRGGAEVQVDRTREELLSLGIEVNILTSEDRDVGDIVHFFGSWDCHYLTSTSLQRRGVPYVCSPIWASRFSPRQERIRTLRKRITGKFPRYLNKLFTEAHQIITLSTWEQNSLRAVFSLPSSNFVQIPNGVDDRFANADPELFRATTGIEGDYVLHSGSLYPDKNQLGLIHALRDTDIQIVFMGPTLETGYAEECLRAAGPRVKFAGSFPSDSPVLPSAYAGAKVFCLPSKFEVFSLAALEAGAAGCPLVLSNTWGAEEHFGERAAYVKHDSIAEIRRSVMRAWETLINRAEQSSYFVGKFSWQTVAHQLKSVYESVLKDRSRHTPTHDSQ